MILCWLIIGACIQTCNSLPSTTLPFALIRDGQRSITSPALPHKSSGQSPTMHVIIHSGEESVWGNETISAGVSASTLLTSSPAASVPLVDYQSSFQSYWNTLAYVVGKRTPVLVSRIRLMMWRTFVYKHDYNVHVRRVLDATINGSGSYKHLFECTSPTISTKEDEEHLYGGAPIFKGLKARGSAMWSCEELVPHVRKDEVLCGDHYRFVDYIPRDFAEVSTSHILAEIPVWQLCVRLPKSSLIVIARRHGISEFNRNQSKQAITDVIRTHVCYSCPKFASVFESTNSNVVTGRERTKQWRERTSSVVPNNTSIEVPNLCEFSTPTIEARPCRYNSS